MDREMPATADRASTPAVPRRRTHHEIIDVDELDDEQDQRPPRRPRRPEPRGNSSIEPVSPEIIILDSDDGSEAGPSTRRTPSGKPTLTLSVVLSPYSVNSRFSITFATSASTNHPPPTPSPAFTLASSSTPTPTCLSSRHHSPERRAFRV